mmetsp:Transcript_3356/g.5255  ORF Transcript_3356/g.5255 Transcript_3356/m.5255 type:complete len:724 (+) Transcript_3356:362-2533(+)
MLHIATWYKQGREWSQHSDYVHIGYLVVFLVMHTSTSTRPTSPTRHSAYESVWPSEGGSPLASPPTVYPSVPTPTSPPTSPSKVPLRKTYGTGPGSHSATPLSPRGSPRQSPKRSPLKTPTYYKSATQHLSFVREKLPTLVHALSVLEGVAVEHEAPGDGQDIRRLSDDSTTSDKMASIFVSSLVSPAGVEALVLVLGAGPDDRTEAKSIISLYPGSQGSFDEVDGGVCGDEDITRSGISCSDIIEWIDSHLHLNEYLYPPCPISSTNAFASCHSCPPPSSPRSNPDNTDAVMSDPDSEVPGSPDLRVHALHSTRPIRRTIDLSSSVAKEPTVVHGSCTTAIHVLTVNSGSGDPGAPVPIPSHLRSISSETAASGSVSGMNTENSDDELADAGKGGAEGGIGSASADPSSSGYSLGPALLHGCSRMTIYLLGAYSFVSVSSCTDCEVVIGAVAGALLVSGCERVTITASCRKLVLWNCHDCELRIATLTPTITSGDCRGLVVGPFNTAYRLLRVHMRLAHLDNLISSSHVAVSSNCWREIYDVATCLDTPAPSPPTSAPPSPRSKFLAASGQSAHFSMECRGIDLTSGLSSLPKPPDSVVTLQNPEKYAFLSIPYQSEYQPQEMSPILTPERYAEAFMRRKQVHSDMERHINATLGKATGQDCAALFGKLVSQSFLEWVAKSGKSQQLMDLVRLDSEETNNTGRNSAKSNRDSAEKTVLSNNW